MERSQNNTMVAAKSMIGGEARGELVHSRTELSFWGGVDAQTGTVIDYHHDLNGVNLTGKILAIPGSRGSCAGSGVLIELLLAGRSPAALLLERADDIMSLGVVVAEEIFGVSIPVLVLGSENFRRFERDGEVTISNSQIRMTDFDEYVTVEPWNAGTLALSPLDVSYLEGSKGKAAQAAMRIVIRMARLQNAPRLHDISRVHIDGCFYSGPASFKFAEQLRNWGGSVAVPTTTNSTSVDIIRWRDQKVDPAFADAAVAISEAYVGMGARPTFTCAPYLLDNAPRRAEQIAWAESNAAVFANSVLGARTMKYPDYLDACIALTGRAPLAGGHTDSGRQPALAVTVENSHPISNEFYPLLGYAVGRICQDRVPVIYGLENAAPTRDDLKSFSAAFAVTSGAPMFHIRGVTPEARDNEFTTKDVILPSFAVKAADLKEVWDELDASGREDVGLVSLGNPHFSLSEFQTLADLCRGRFKHPGVSIIVTSGRDIYAKATEQGIVDELEAFGVKFITDTCWCLIGGPIITDSIEVIMTNSAKYAHYGPGLTGREFRFGNLSACVEVVCSGKAIKASPT